MDEQLTNRGGPLYWFKRRSRRFWIIATALPVLYVASFGPACWIAVRTKVGTSAIPVVYRPILLSWSLSESQAIGSAINWYASAGMPKGEHWELWSEDGYEWIFDCIELAPPAP